MGQACKVAQRCKAEHDYQQFPTSGALGPSSGKRNLALAELRRRIKGGNKWKQAEVYGYVIATVKSRGGPFIQTGSAPNFQGGLITLCTCMHQMRTSLDTSKCEKWEGKWIAGFASSSRKGRNALVYLMKVDQAFASQRRLWHGLSAEAKREKSACKSEFGDVYRPRSESGLREFDHRSYYRPCATHKHANCWHRDINYTDGYGGRKPKLLVGDPAFSFLWDRPTVFYKGHHPRQKKSVLGDLLGQLRG